MLHSEIVFGAFIVPLYPNIYGHVIFNLFFSEVSSPEFETLVSQVRFRRVAKEVRYASCWASWRSTVLVAAIALV